MSVRSVVTWAAVSPVAERAGDRFIWRNFGCENNYEVIIHAEEFEEAVPYTFDRAGDEEAIRQAL